MTLMKDLLALQEVDDGWKDVAKIGGALGAAGALGLAGYRMDKNTPKVEIGGTEAYLITEPNAGTVPVDAITLTGKDGKKYIVWKGRKEWFAVPASAIKEEEDSEFPKVIAKADEFRVELDGDEQVHLLDGEDTVRVSMPYVIWKQLTR